MQPGWAAAFAAVFDGRLAIAAAVTAAAGVMRGFAGFGTAITLAPAFSVLWGPAVGVPTMLLMEALIGSQLLVGAWRDVNRRVTVPITLAACLLVPVGTWILVLIDPAALTRAMGALVLLFGALLASGWRYRGARPLPLNLAVGATAGVLKGATGMSGPPVILYLLAGNEAAKEHRANLILFFAVLGLVALIPPLLTGLFTLEVLAKVAVLTPWLLVFVRIGAALFGRIGARQFRTLAYGVLAAVGVAALLA
jgi:uncharacterized membrane protein YfcA